MPLRRACIVHRLDDLIFRAEGGADQVGVPTHGEERFKPALYRLRPIVRFRHRTLLDIGG